MVDRRDDLDASKSWCVGHDPDLVPKYAEFVGLCLDPPDGALVLSVQALERAQGYFTLPNSRTLTGRSYDYKRHGTTTLFAALDVATGAVETGPPARPPSTIGDGSL